jgi:HPt (histidine-containing phosphotransfer) domain-containing protein
MINKWTGWAGTVVPRPLPALTSVAEHSAAGTAGPTVRATGDHSSLTDDLLAMLIADLPRQRESIAAAHRAGDSRQLKDCVHYLHGGAAYCGVPRLANAAARVERLLPDATPYEIASAMSALQLAIDELLTPDPRIRPYPVN